jgi:putative membrane protein
VIERLGSVAGSIAVGAWLIWPYVVGVRRRRARGARTPATIEILAYVAGSVVVSLAVTGPVDSAVDRSFAAHMAQHVALMMVAAPLLAAGRPMLALSALVPREGRARLDRWRRSMGTGRSGERRRIVAGLIASTTALWAWHTPPAFDAALRSTPVHLMEHAILLATAAMFWSPLIGVARSHRTIGPAVVSLLVGATQSAALGALLTFSTVPWYPPYASAAASRAAALADQQLAGLVMWIPAGVVYLCVFSLLGSPTRSAATPRHGPRDRRV